MIIVILLRLYTIFFFAKRLSIITDENEKMKHLSTGIVAYIPVDE